MDFDQSKGLKMVKLKGFGLTLVFVIGITCHFIADEFGRLHLADAAEETPQLILGHTLGQVIDDEVGFGIFGLIFHVVIITIIVNLLLQWKKKKERKKKDTVSEYHLQLPKKEQSFI